MQTAVISYRVADFLKQHPPFQYMDEADLVTLASHGRVKFHESDEYLIWQGSSHGANILVIQQGTVSLWDERGEDGDGDVLRDICGAGDILGIDHFAGSPKSLHSAKSTSDVVVYAFPSGEFAELVAKYPAAAEYVAAAASATGVEYRADEHRHLAEEVFLYDVVRGKSQDPIASTATIREAAAALLASGRDAVGVVNEHKQLHGILTSERILQWAATQDAAAAEPVSKLLDAPACTVALDAPISACVLTMASQNARAAAILEKTHSGDRFHGIVTAADLAPVFGEQPAALLHDIRTASDLSALRECNQRVRTFLAENLNRAESVDWLSRFASEADGQILARILRLTKVPDDETACWCVIGATGRQESLTLAAPGIALIHAEGAGAARQHFETVLSALSMCGYLTTDAAKASAVCASTEAWKTRFSGWLEDPIQNDIFAARPMFDLRPFAGNPDLFRQIRESVSGGVSKSFLYLLANDCLSNLPPLTFFRDAVVHGSGEQSDVFDLQRTALEPLVDVGRVFGLAAGHPFGSTTLERFTWAKSMLPEQELIFREASETLRAVLFHQARVGIRERTDGAELPPALLSRHDRQVLKNGFRAILKLLEFTAECEWLEKV
ncbi:MAG: putative nucleotidyltransferase substrate binding domain-containing protein [Bryobacteraceae bacterium]